MTSKERRENGMLFITGDKKYYYKNREIDEEIDEDDISLDQFSDDIEDWIIDILKKQGYTTARQVMGTNREELAQKADLEEETVDEIIRILSAEFEK